MGENNLYVGGRGLIKSEVGIFEHLVLNGKDIPEDLITKSEPAMLTNKKFGTENTSFVDLNDETKSISFDLSASDSGASTKINISSIEPRAYTFVDQGKDANILLSEGHQEINGSLDILSGAQKLKLDASKGIIFSSDKENILLDINGVSVGFSGKLKGDVNGSMDNTVLSLDSIYDKNIHPDANISDTKLSEISTPGKILNSATTATPKPSPMTIVLRNEDGGFEAGTIVGNFVGDLTGRVNGSSINVTGGFSGDVSGTQDNLIINPKSILDNHISDLASISDLKLATISSKGKVSNSATSATSDILPLSIVLRDENGNFEAGTIIGNITGTAGGFTSCLMGAVKGTQNATIISDGVITNNHLSDEILIKDSKLDVISSVGKVLNSATTSTTSNLPGTIVLRGTGNEEIGLPPSRFDKYLQVAHSESDLRLAVSDAYDEISIGSIPGDASIKIANRKNKIYVGYNDDAPNDSGFIVEHDSVIFNTQIVTTVVTSSESLAFIKKYLPVSKSNEPLTINNGESARFSDSISFDASSSTPLFYLSHKSAGTIIALQGILMITLTDGSITSVVKSNWSGIVNPSMEAHGSYIHVDSSTSVCSFGGQGINITPVLAWKELSDNKIYIEISFAGIQKGKMSVTHLTDVLVSVDSTSATEVQIWTK